MGTVNQQGDPYHHHHNHHTAPITRNTWPYNMLACSVSEPQQDAKGDSVKEVKQEIDSTQTPTQTQTQTQILKPSIQTNTEPTTSSNSDNDPITSWIQNLNATEQQQQPPKEETSSNAGTLLILGTAAIGIAVAANVIGVKYSRQAVGREFSRAYESHLRSQKNKQKPS